MRKLQVHTVDQPDSDTTTYIISCNRLDLLDRTIKSFLSTRDYPTKMVLIDNSAVPEVHSTLVEKYGTYCDVYSFPENRGIWWAMDFMVSICYTEYVFYLEEDWEFLLPGYLNTSKEILLKYREIGFVDISMRTFEDEGYDTYHKQLIDNKFFYKKPWRLSDKHLFWNGWAGAPNLKRRDDLIWLGRVEKWHNEWNIDRRFHALGFKSVVLKDRHVDHIGWGKSLMAGNYPSDQACPEDFFPGQVRANRIWPNFDYYHLDRQDNIANLNLQVNYNRIENEEISFANNLAKWFKDILKPISVLDIGCGPGIYVQSLHEHGVFAEGLDVDPRVKGKQHLFHMNMFDLDPKFRSDAVLCLETAEHINPELAENVVETVARATSKTLIWTAAHPGQSGEGHINLRPKEYWQALFEAQGLKRNLLKEAELITHIKGTGYYMGWFVQNILYLERG